MQKIVSLLTAAFLAVIMAVTSVGAATAAPTAVQVVPAGFQVTQAQYRDDRGYEYRKKKHWDRRDRGEDRYESRRDRREHRYESRRDRRGYWHGHRGYREHRRGYRRHSDGYWYPLTILGL